MSCANLALISLKMCINNIFSPAGCYWGTEKYFQKDFKDKFPDVLVPKSGAVGFMGPASAPPNPSYKQVCSGSTGHVEVYQISFKTDDEGENFRNLVKFFFQFHDPTTLNRQGNDTGTQYASVIYTGSAKQTSIANDVKKELQENLDAKKIKFINSSAAFKGDTVTTDIRESTKFYPAHAEHQEYLAKNPNGYCNHRIRFKSWPYRPMAAYTDVE